MYGIADVINAPTYYSVQSGLEYEISTNVTSSWINHTSADFVISNSGDETIHNWYLTFNTPYVIDNIWNADFIERIKFLDQNVHDMLIPRVGACAIEFVRWNDSKHFDTLNIYSLDSEKYPYLDEIFIISEFD